MKSDKGHCRRWFDIIKDYDQGMSEKIASNNSTCVEIIFFFIPAHMFNRIVILLPMAITFIIGASDYDTMLMNNNFKPRGDKITDTDKITYGYSFWLLFSLALGVSTLSSTILKNTIKRERPKARTDTTRISNLRGKEIGTFAMPSGDSNAAAVFCLLLAAEFDINMIYLIMPLVMLGRVYYQCHWLGDTIAGFLHGTMWGILFAYNFNIFVPLFEMVTGEDAFISNVDNSAGIKI